MKIMTLKLNKSTIGGLITIGILIILSTLPLYAATYTIILLNSILFYIILTVSWVLFSGPTGYISLAPAAFIGVGIYTSAIFGDALPFPVIVSLAGLGGFILAILVGALTLRLKGIYFAIFTFGLVEFIRHLVLFLELRITGTRGRFVVALNINTIYFYILGVFIVLLLVTYIIKRSKYGLALRSIGQNEEAAAHIGINVTVLKVITFSISALFMSIAGAIMATRWTYIDPGIAFNIFYSFMPVLMAIFGGMGQLYGPILGSAIFTYLEEFLLTKFSELYMLIFGIIFLVAILYLPDGLIGLIQKWRKARLGGTHAST